MVICREDHFGFMLFVIQKSALDKPLRLFSKKLQRRATYSEHRLDSFYRRLKIWTNLANSDQSNGAAQQNGTQTLIPQIKGEKASLQLVFETQRGTGLVVHCANTSNRWKTEIDHSLCSKTISAQFFFID